MIVAMKPYSKLSVIWASCLSILLCDLVVSFEGVEPLCSPVTLSICSETSDIISLDTRRGGFGGTEEPSNDHRKSRGKRNVGESDDVIPWRYNVTTYPTFTNDKSEDEIITSLSGLHPLISTKCSKYISLFLCSVYSPVCTPRGVVPPCRELCERVKDDCSDITDMFGIEWPERFNCDYYPPVQQEGKRLGGVAGTDYLTDNTFLISRQTPIIWVEALLDDGNVCIPPSSDDVILPALHRLEEADGSRDHNETNRPYADFGVWCPADMRAPPGHSGYTFMGLPNCTAPCPNMYLEEDQLWIVRYFICVLAVICVIVTSFTILTFAIDRKRFLYPERPIVFYAFSYLVVSIVFLIGFGLGEQVACNEKVENDDNEVVQGFAVVEGSHHRLCSIMFMVLYYFTVNGTIWWLILTITWLLAAGFKWGYEAIENYHLYYHAVAWGLPAVQTLIVFISNKIEGDNIAGVCFVGLYDTDGLRYLLLLPMCTYLLIGIGVLFTGFFSLNRVRKKLQGDEAKKERLAKFMLRIGVFSVMYILPQIALIVIYAVEDINRRYWEAAWYAEACADNAVPCPAPTHAVGVLASGSPHPGIFIFCFKYMMTLIVALPPLFWVASRKTLHSWGYFCTRKRSKAKLQLNTTETRLLNDSNGPHARDRQAKLMGHLESPDLVFGDLCNAENLGSSASIAARQREWEDLTDSFSSDSGTSVMDSELSRILAQESRRNKGVLLKGRKGFQPNMVAARPSKQSNRNNRTDPCSTVQSANVQVHQDNSLQRSNTEPKPTNGSEVADAVFPNSKSDNTLLRKPTGSPALPDTSLKHSKQLNKEKLDQSKPVGQTPVALNRQKLSPLALESNIKPFQKTDDSQRSENKAGAKTLPLYTTTTPQRGVPTPCPRVGRKPKTPPPHPPPRVDSIVVLGNLSPERALSV